MNHMVLSAGGPGFGRGAEIRIERAVLGVVLQKRADLVEEGHDAPAAVLGQFSADKVERLDAVGPS
jgi:hypothetical protein